MKTLIITIILLAFNVMADFSAKVVRVIDGDTIEVLTADNHKIRIRLADIDAPELGQPYSTKSKQYLASLIDKKQVLIKDKGLDIYQRTLAIIFYHQKNINEIMVKNGYAWAYRINKIATNQRIARFQSQAKQQKIGLWQDKNPIEPRVYKKLKQKNPINK